MNITKEQIVYWLNNNGIQSVSDEDLVNVMEQCFNDLAPKSEWVSVEDRLPEVGVRVLIFTTQPLEAVMYRNNRFNRFGMDIDYATHWMPLPEPPK